MARATDASSSQHHRSGMSTDYGYARVSLGSKLPHRTAVVVWIVESECRGLGADHLGNLLVATGPLPCKSRGRYAGERQDSIRWPFVSQRRFKLQRASCPVGMRPRAALLWSMRKARDINNGSASLVRGCSRHAWSCELDRANPGLRGRGKTAAVGRRAGRGEADGSKPCVRPEEDNAGSWNCEGPNCPPTLNDWGAWQHIVGREKPANWPDGVEATFVLQTFERR